MSKEVKSQEDKDPHELITRRWFLISGIGASAFFVGGVTDGYFNFRNTRKAISEAEIETKKHGIVPPSAESVAKAESIARGEEPKNIQKNEMEQARKRGDRR